MKYFGLAIFDFDIKNANYIEFKRLQNGKNKIFFVKIHCSVNALKILMFNYGK